MKITAEALAVTRAQSKGQQGPGRRSTIANFDQPFCMYVLYVLRPPNCSTSQMSWAPFRGLALWLRGLMGRCSVRTTFPTTKI
jgi:hypothetical protein